MTRPPLHAALLTALLTALLAALLTGLLAMLAACTPTLSAPNEAHLDAMAVAGRHYGHGRMLASADAYARAAGLADRRVDREEARYRQAKALERAGRYGQALVLLDDLAEARPVARRQPRALYDAALLRLERGDREAGLAGMRRVIHRHPESGLASQALRHLLRDLEAQDDPEMTLTFLRELDREVGETTLGDDILSAQAEILVAEDRPAEARAVLERLVEEHPYPEGQRWDDAHWELADLAEAAGQPAEAVAYLERMLSVHEESGPPGSYTLPKFPAAAIRIARLHRDALDDPAAAKEAFRRAYEDFPDSRLRDDALVELGELHIAEGVREEGCELLRQAMEEFEVGQARRRAAERIARDCG